MPETGVLDRFGEVRTVRDTEFRASHDPLGGELWRRVGTYRAWQVSEALVIRTKEGRATAGPETGWLKDRSASAGQSVTGSSGGPTGPARSLAKKMQPGERQGVRLVHGDGDAVYRHRAGFNGH
jgi:hypothetical protein